MPLWPRYVTLDAAAQALQDDRDGLLGVLGFPELPLTTCRDDVPAARVGAGGIGAGASPSHLCELWLSPDPVRAGVEGAIRYAVSGDFLFGVASRGGADATLRDLSEAIYSEIFRALDRLGFPHALRFWNYFPCINETEGGLERYRQFNLGRAAAFDAAGRYRTATLPAACALGTDSGAGLTVYFVAAREPGIAIENPRQVSAYDYPREYGPRSPTFSRAVLHRSGPAAILFVSGTASIVGHRTVHAGDPAAQTRETLANLEAVFLEAGKHVRPGAFTRRESSYKVYVRHSGDLPAIRREVERAMGDEADAVYLRADICRSDLLVEIEAVAWSGERAGDGRTPA